MQEKSDIDVYCETWSEEQPQLLAQLERETYLKTVNPNMLSGQLQGRLLSFISKLLQPKFILEIGTFTGYATHCLAEGLHHDGEIHTIEVKAELEPIAQQFFQQSAKKDQIFSHYGNAQEIIPNLNQNFDLVFIDAGKADYESYYDLVIEKVNKGGVIIADNVVWYGKVADNSINDKRTQALHFFNQKVKKDSRVENFILPLRDGLNIIRKK